MKRLLKLDETTEPWAAIAVAVTSAFAVVCATFCLVGGVDWIGFGAVLMTAGIIAGAWYTLGGRTLAAGSEIRERTVQRHYVGVAWYSSMLRTTVSNGGYERGLRTEMTRLTAVRLAERHGISLYLDTAAARALIGEELWPLVDPDGAPEAGSPPRLVPARMVGHLVDLLERL